MQRRLSAILAADVVGYSRMMGQDEAATLKALHDLRTDVFGPIFADQKGKIVKSMGDGWLIEFSSSVQSVNAAMLVQDRLKSSQGLQLRMGIHIGDITESDGEIYGDGINIAARLEALAPPGGILISDAVYSSLDGTLSPSFEAGGARSLKNIDRKVTTWVRASETVSFSEATTDKSDSFEFPMLNIVPVVTADTRAEVQELANAMTADLATHFGGISWLTATVAGEPQEASYVLRVNLRSQGDRLRLETRLLDAESNTVWSDKSNGSLSDSFDWQDQVVELIAAHATNMILETETLKIVALPDDALHPEQCMLMGMMVGRSFSPEAFVASTEFQARAIAGNPNLAEAYAEAIFVVTAGRTIGFIPRLEPFVKMLPEWVKAAGPLAPGNAMLTLSIGLATYQNDGRILPYTLAIDQVLRLAPFDGRVLSFSGWANLWAGRTQAGLDCFVKAARLGRLSPFLPTTFGGAATACVQLGQDELALDYSRQGLALTDNYPTLFASQAAAQALMGDIDAAQSTMQSYSKIMPDRTITSWKAVNDYGGTKGGERYFEGLRLAGMPEE